MKNKLLLLKDIKTYWRNPQKGRYMPFSEIAAYSVGGLGAYFIFTMAQTLLLSTTNVIIGNTIGIQPMHMYIMYVASVITNIPLTMVRANMVDNVKHRQGKYRPYLISMGIPTALVSMLFVFTPYSSVGYIWRCVLVFVYNFALQFFYNFFYDAYENLIYVLSPNSQERTDVTAIKSVIYSLSPTITNFITPLIAGKVASGNMYDLRVYRWLYPFIAVFGVALVVLVYSKTEEKIVIAKTHPVKIGFFDALREVAKNKYFWIISLAGWLGFLETATSVVLQWLYNYAHLCTAAQYSFITLIRGTAYVWGMVLAPFAIKKWGKKKVLIATNLFNVFALALVYPLIGSIWTVLICMYLNSIADSFILVLNPAIQADIRDYQQYESGERIDGMFSAVGLIGSFITMATSSVLPAVYEKFGICAGNGYENMYDVLYDSQVLYKLVGVLVILSAVGAFLNVVPYFFYDLSETKQKGIIEILKIRAVIEDYNNGALGEEELQSKKDELTAVFEKAAGTPPDIKNLKKSGASKAEIKAALASCQEYEIASAIAAELNRFTTAASKARLERAEAFVAMGIDNIAKADDLALTQAKKLPGKTAEEREIRKNAVADARELLRSKKAALKYYPDGIKAFDENNLKMLYEKESALGKEKQEKLKAGADKSVISGLNKELDEIEKRITDATKERERFTESTRAYEKAGKYIETARQYDSFCQLLFSKKLFTFE